MAVPLILDQMQMVDQVDLVVVQELNNQEWLVALVTHLLLVLLKEIMVVIVVQYLHPHPRKVLVVEVLVVLVETKVKVVVVEYHHQLLLLL